MGQCKMENCHQHLENIWVLQGVRDFFFAIWKGSQKKLKGKKKNKTWLTLYHGRAAESCYCCILLSSQQPVIMNWLTAKILMDITQEGKWECLLFFIVNLYWTLSDSPPIYNPVWSSRKLVLEVSHERELCFYLTKALWIFSHFLFDLSVNFLHPLPLLLCWSS